MKKRLATNSVLTLFTVFFLFSGISQKANAQDFQERFDKVWELSNDSKFDQALPQFFDLLKEQPYNEQLHVQISWVYLCQKNMPKAKEYIDYAYDLKSDDIAVALTKCYYEFANGNKDQGIYFLDMGFWLDYNGQNKASIINDFTNLKTKYGLNPAMMDFAISRVNSQYDSRNKSYISTFKLINEAYGYLSTKEYVKAQQTYKKVMASYQQAPPAYQFLKANAAQSIANWFKYYYLPDDLEYANLALDIAKANPGKVSPLVITNASYVIADHYFQNGDLEKALVVCESNESNLKRTISYGNYKANFLTTYLGILNKKGANNATSQAKMVSLANQLFALKNTGYDAYFQAKAQNFLGIAYLVSVIPADRAKAATYIENAIRIASTNNYPDLVTDFSSGLALVYWQKGDKQKAKDVYVAAISAATKNGDYSTAENSANNLGSLFYMDKNFVEAAKYFQQSVNFTEQIRDKLNTEQKLLYLQQNVGSYKFLVSSYARSGNGAKVFEVQNKDRARVLSETINKKQNTTPTVLPEFQNLLKTDEAAIFYSLLEPGAFVINVVTKDGVFPFYTEDFKPWVAIKKKYLDFMHAATKKKSDYSPATGYIEKDGIKYKVSDNLQVSTPDMIEIMELTRECLQDMKGDIPASVRDDLLSVYYQALIAPVLGKISGKKKLIIFSDGYLNFLPFEALLSPSKSYLIQNFDVRYCQSADIFKMVNGRNYSPQRKDFLGMGGAVYQDMAERSEIIRTPEQMLKAQVQAKENALNNKPQRLIYAGIYGSSKMNYLPGTLQEVKNLSNIFTSKDVFTGTEMTENLIKKMSVTGQLKNYKILHLATHGFAVEQVPELSGIAMCIPTQMQAGEDGFLNAPEIAKLNVNADIAVLSACDTGLGKIYEGEGVSGLTGSLLVAGANQALVSLWPVSDVGTMYFMTGMYQLTNKVGKNYDEAIAIMKRRFIKGEFGPQFTHFNFWAPYIAYGK